jgi:hypothetical protein
MAEVNESNQRGADQAISGNPDTATGSNSAVTLHRKLSRDVVVAVALWIGGGAVIAYLVVQRYRGAIGIDPLQHGNNVDFRSFFRAAQDVADGRSPYSGLNGYTYFATLALILSPTTHANPVTVLKVWTVLGLCAYLASVSLIVWELRDRLGAAWEVALLFIVSAGIGLHAWPVVYEFFLGNDDLFVLLLVVVAAIAWRANRPVLFGVVVGTMCLIKIWPVIVLVVVLQAGVNARRRIAAVAAAGGIVVLGLLSDLIPAGVREFTGFRSAIHASETLRLVSDSVSGIPKVLFSDTGLARPLTVSGGLQYLLTALLAAWVIGLLVVALLGQREPILCTFNVVLFAVLVVPVSHMCYTLLALPVVWFWLANARVVLDRRYRQSRQIAGMAAVALSVVGWILVNSKAWPGDGSSAGISSIRFTVVFLANLALYSTSVLAGRLLLGRVEQTPDVQRPHPNDVLAQGGVVAPQRCRVSARLRHSEACGKPTSALRGVRRRGQSHAGMLHYGQSLQQW